MPSPRLCSWETVKTETLEVIHDTWDDIRNTRPTAGLFLAIFCVGFVLVGNVILLIAINFWISIFPSSEMESNSSQIAIQVIVTAFLVMFFVLVAIVFAIVFGAYPLWRALVANDRMGHPAYRFFLLFASGASNAICGLLGTYAMTYTPEYIQAVLMCAIPFSAQAWTVLFIPEERHRNYLSIFFLASFVFFVAGVLLSSMNAFLHADQQGNRVSWAWALIYLASSVVFGLWCVVQRLYLDAIIFKDAPLLTEGLLAQEADAKNGKHRGGDEGDHTDDVASPHKSHVVGANAESSDELNSRNASASYIAVKDAAAAHGRENNSDSGSLVLEGEHYAPKAKGGSRTRADDEVSEAEDEGTVHIRDPEMGGPALIAEKRNWGTQNVDDNAGKVVLLVGGIFFQLTVSFVCFPIDAIPWFGTSDNAQHAWDGFARSVRFIFASWYNVRYGLLYALGYAMSFIGCAYLNEHSPTLASVVLQLAGPITSIVIIAVPPWNVYKDNSNVGQKVGGAILLLVAALLYHVWEQNSMKRLLARAHAARATASAAEPITDDTEHARNEDEVAQA